jgi:hypothetical protein
VKRDNETPEQLLAGLKAQNAETLRQFAEADWDTRCRFRMTSRGFRGTSTTRRCAGFALHLLEELTRHAGHTDIIRESIDGATMYELMAGVECWPETDWIKPWSPAGTTRLRRRR